METDPPSPKRPGPQDGVDDALRVAAKYFGVSVADLRSSRRTSLIHPARAWAAYLASTTTDASFGTIGKSLRRDWPVMRIYARSCARKAKTTEGAQLYAALKARRAVL